MTTKRELIEAAFGEIGLADYVFDLTPEELQDALKRANRMAAMWDGLLVRLGYNLGGDIDSEAGIPDTAEECFAIQLGIRLAPLFGKVLSPDTKVAAKNALTALLATNAKRPECPMPGTMPLGTGNRRGVLDQQYYPVDEAVPGLNDGALEY